VAAVAIASKMIMMTFFISIRFYGFRFLKSTSFDLNCMIQS
jgi:hypothetical protein